MSPIDFVLLGASVFAALYWLGALICVDLFSRRRPTPPRSTPPVSMLKPLRGDDGHLHENLRSFCEQDYPRFEVIFGVQSLDDPAVAVVDRLIREFPHLALRLVVDERAIGTNRKASNLANLVRQAKHDTFILADGDMRVDPAYIRAVVASLEERTVGLVTCLYSGVAHRGIASQLNAMFINEWFLPAALVGARIERLCHAFGATIACRRDTLRAIGGFDAVANHLADDYMLGWLTSRRGLRVALAPYLVENVVAERDLRSLFFHELRWARTLRTVRPVSYFCSLFTYGIPVSLIWAGVGTAGRMALLAAGLHVGLRCLGRALLYRSLNRRVPWSKTWLVPVRDTASFILGVLSFFGHTVRWHDEPFRVRRDGRLEHLAAAPIDGHPSHPAGLAPIAPKSEDPA
jgi:ceramide glucosyltransferase